MIEGIWGTWDKCASPGRHPDFRKAVEEAVIAWSAPQPFHPEAVPFITRALNHHFGKKDWNFTHVDHWHDHHIGRALGKGKVNERLKKSNDKLRLPSEMYDVAP